MLECRMRRNAEQPYEEKAVNATKTSRLSPSASGLRTSRLRALLDSVRGVPGYPTARATRRTAA